MNRNARAGAGGFSGVAGSFGLKQSIRSVDNKEFRVSVKQLYASNKVYMFCHDVRVFFF
jgi:hypothetical protein